MDLRKPPRYCVSCNTQLKGGFCHNCGEKELTSKDRSIKLLIGQFISAFTFVDNKFYRTMKVFLFKPGLLSEEYIEGKRKKYLLPISLFLMINLVFFVLNPVTDFNLSLYEQTSFQQYKEWAKLKVDYKMIERGESFKEYEQVYNARSSNLSRSLILINVPILAFLVSLIYFRSDRYFVDHFVFSLHLFGFLLLNFILWGSFYLLLAPLIESENQSSGLSLGSILLIFLLFIYTYFSQKRFFKPAKFMGIVKSVLTFVALIFILWFYRLILFIVVISVT